MDLDASEEQLDCPFLFASARDGYAVRELDDLVNNKKDMTPLFDTILDYIPAPEGDPDANTQVLISTIAVSYTHLDVYKRQRIPSRYA